MAVEEEGVEKEEKQEEQEHREEKERNRREVHRKSISAIKKPRHFLPAYVATGPHSAGHKVCVWVQCGSHG